MSKPNGILSRGSWRAVPAEVGGYELHSPGAYDTFRGHARTREAAEVWLDEASGQLYARLPVVKRSELREVLGERIDLPGGCGFYQHTFFYHGDRFLGSVQYRERHGRHDWMTCPAGKQNAILTADVRWLCQENGLQLVDDMR